MYATETEIKIDLDEIDKKKAPKGDAAPKKDDPAPPVVETAAKSDEKPIVTTDEGLEKLKQQLADEKRMRLAAEARASDATNAAVAARTDSRENQLHLIKTAIENVTQNNDLLESKLAEAYAGGDFATAAKINREMTANSAKLVQLEGGKVALEKAPKPAPPVSADPVERLASTLSPRSAAWVRSHPDFVLDPKLNRKMVRADEDARDAGIAPDTDAYFEHVEKTLGLRTTEVQRTDADPMADAASTATSQRSPPAAAPVTRSGNGAGARAGVVTLTPAQLEMAEACGQTPEEYARNMVSLRKERRLN
jgi:hypothetical protein